MGRFGIYAPKPPYWALVQNESAETAPSEGIIQIAGASTNPDILLGRKPERSSITRIGILPLDIVPGTIGRVILHGQHRVTVALKPGESLSAGDRVRPHKDSWHARKFYLGPMLVEEVLGPASNTGASDITTTALVRLDRRRGDYQYVYKTDGSVQDAYASLIFGRGYAIDASVAGRPHVNKVQE